MDIKKKIKIELSEKDVKEIIAERLWLSGFRVDLDDIHFDVTAVGKGNGRTIKYTNHIKCIIKV